MSRTIDVMTPHPFMLGQTIGAIPVVDEYDQPLGIVSYVEVLHGMGRRRDEAAE